MIKTNQKNISASLLAEIKDALESVNYGSIEIFVQNKVVTQITVRNIHKTSVEIEPDQESNSPLENKVYMQNSSVKVQH